MQAGLTDHAWEIAELVDVLEDREATEQKGVKRGPYRVPNI